MVLPVLPDQQSVFFLPQFQSLHLSALLKVVLVLIDTFLDLCALFRILNLVTLVLSFYLQLMLVRGVLLLFKVPVLHNLFNSVDFGSSHLYLFARAFFFFLKHAHPVF
jgi:hypothetical protein